MFYQFLKILVGYTLRIFFKNIYITGTEHVKKNKAQLVASNHPNGFLEPLIMACFFPKDLHFLVRGDVFDNPFLKPILISTHQIPIFRFRDGFSKLRENSTTMDASSQVLLDKKNLLIFAEGGTESIKKLRPLQKGIARIAFQALEKDPNLDLEILPVGINFTYPAKFNKEVMLRVSPPMKVSPYFEIYKTDKNKAMDLLLADLYDQIKANVIHLENQHLSPVFENLVVAERSMTKKALFPVMIHENLKLDNEKELAENLDKLDDAELHTLKTSVTGITKDLKTNGYAWSDLVKNPLNIINIILLTVGLIPAALGFLLHIIPIGVGHFFTKTKVKQKEFKASILMVSTLMMMLIQYVILILVIAFTSITWVWILVFIVTGLCARFYFTLYSNTAFTFNSGFSNIKKEAQALAKSLRK